MAGNSGNHNRRTTQVMANIELRRLQILEMLTAGCYTLEQIAAKVGASPATVYKDVKAVRKRSIMMSICLDDQLAQREIAVLRKVQREAWDGYQRSRRDEQSVEQELMGEGSKAKLTLKKKKIRTQAGSAAFLNAVIQAQKTICEIEGLVGKDKFDDRPADQTPKLLRVVVQSREEAQRYESLRLEQVERLGIIEGSAKPAGPGESSHAD